MFFNKKYKLGDLKKLEDITIHDMINYPIWVNDLSGESIDSFDEISERPVINTKNLLSKIVKKYVSTSILVKFINKDLFGSANYEEDGTLSSIVFWVDDKWLSIDKVFHEKDEVIIISIPSIDEATEVKYSYDFKEKYAKRVN